MNEGFELVKQKTFSIFNLMTIEERKISLINWISNLEDEQKINQIEAFRKASMDDLPNEIVELLKISDSEPIEDCIAHSSSRNLLNKK